MSIFSIPYALGARVVPSITTAAQACQLSSSLPIEKCIEVAENAIAAQGELLLSKSMAAATLAAGSIFIYQATQAKTWSTTLFKAALGLACISTTILSEMYFADTQTTLHNTPALHAAYKTL